MIASEVFMYIHTQNISNKFGINIILGMRFWVGLLAWRAENKRNGQTRSHHGGVRTCRAQAGVVGSTTISWWGSYGIAAAPAVTLA